MSDVALALLAKAIEEFAAALKCVRCKGTGRVEVAKRYSGQGDMWCPACGGKGH